VLQESVARGFNTEQSSIRLLLDGDLMDYDQTPHSITMKEGDIIDLMFEQGGC
jgi:hypothetical protein